MCRRIIQSCIQSNLISFTIYYFELFLRNIDEQAGGIVITRSNTSVMYKTMREHGDRVMNPVAFCILQGRALCLTKRDIVHCVNFFNADKNFVHHVLKTVVISSFISICFFFFFSFFDS